MKKLKIKTHTVIYVCVCALFEYLGKGYILPGLEEKQRAEKRDRSGGDE